MIYYNNMSPLAARETHLDMLISGRQIALTASGLLYFVLP
jgi:hypothetical protein